MKLKFSRKLTQTRDPIHLTKWERVYKIMMVYDLNIDWKTYYSGTLVDVPINIRAVNLNRGLGRTAVMAIRRRVVLQRENTNTSTRVWSHQWRWSRPSSERTASRSLRAQVLESRGPSLLPLHPGLTAPTIPTFSWVAKTFYGWFL